MPVLQKLLLIIAINLCWSGVASAVEIFYPLITYKCNIAADIVLVPNSLLPSDEGKNYKYSDADGTYSPWNLVDIDKQMANSRISKTHNLTKVCNLSSGAYTIILKPHIFSRDLSGQCGGSISATFSVEHEGEEIQEPTAFEDYCLGNAPVITRVTVFGKTGQVKIKRIPKYQFY